MKKKLREKEIKIAKDDFVVGLFNNENFLVELKGFVPKVNVNAAKQKVLNRIKNSDQDST